MGRRGGSTPDFQQIMPLSPVVKKLIIANVAIWFLGIVIVEQYFMTEPKISLWFGLTPYKVLKDFWIWQPLTYLFIHSTGPMHIIFNMLLLWWLGSELERHWGAKFFTLYYFVSGVGAAFIYMFTVLIYSIITARAEVLLTPVVGASAAIFGLLVAYGLVFGERIVYFFFFFPMKAKVFVAILGAIEVVLVLNNGLIQGKVANLAHVGGLISGFLFLIFWPWYKGRGSKGGRSSKNRTGKLRLVVNNDDLKEEDKPKYWN
jgi:membrane associated rhomboid family serine protease